jgi:hypothetical protein
VTNASGRWRENLKANWFPILLVSVTISFLLGYFIAQQQETKKQEQMSPFSGELQIVDEQRPIIATTLGKDNVAVGALGTPQSENALASSRASGRVRHA